jgi:DNA repair protein RadD
MEPRWYQQAAHDAAWHYLNTQSGNPLIVLPTGAGKSLVIAMLVQQASEFGARVVVLQHRKELITQNAEKLEILMHGLRTGIYSAGLGRKEAEYDFLFAGIQSVYKSADEIGRRDLIIIDEAHLVSTSDETMYRRFIADIIAANPKARVVGLTATPFRTGEGTICGRKKLFQRICFEAQTGKLIEEGWLCPITNKPAVAQVDSSKVPVRGGEFVEHDLQRVFCADDRVQVACAEAVALTQGRKSILVFSCGVAHAEQIAEELRKTGEEVGIVTGDSIQLERAAWLDRFRRQEVRWLVNCDVLTTGFDAPCVDAIVVMRATMSPGLFCQIVGRGLRKHDCKTDCLVLDFGGNIQRHGSIDRSDFGRSKSQTAGGKADPAEKNGRGKECPNCGLDVAAALTECDECGFAFPVVGRHGRNADTTSQLTGEQEPELLLVEVAHWSLHRKRNDPEAPPTLRIDYECRREGSIGNLTFVVVSEFVCLEHFGFAFEKARQWWFVRSSFECPTSITEAIELMNQGACRMATRLWTVPNGKYTRIKRVEFDDPVPTQLFETVLNDDEDIPF